MRTLLIVNADDFGISEGVNQGIVDGHLRGIITSATAMANLPGFAQAAELRRRYPTLATGVHLNLTTGAPLLPPSRVSSLVDREGRFLRGDRLLMGLTLGRIDPRQAEAELAAQIERAIWAGLSPDHLDSHHHIHCHPALQPPVVRLALRYGIEAIRCPVETGLFGKVRHGDRLKAMGLGVLARLLRWRARRAGIATPDHFRGIALGMGFSRRSLQHALRRLPAGTAELMCHPGYPGGELASLTFHSKGRDSELAALMDPENRRLLEQTGVQLGSYSDLSGRR